MVITALLWLPRWRFGSESCSVHTWNDNLRDSLLHLNAVVTPETCSVYVAYEDQNITGNVNY